MRNIWLTLIACAVCGAGSDPSASDQLPIPQAQSPAALKCDIKLTPQPANPGDETIGTVDVDLVFEAVPTAPGDALLQLALVADNVDTVATTVMNLEAHDAAGPLPLHSHDVELPVEAARDSETGGPTRQWFADRNPEGRVAVHYTVPAMATLPPRGAAPPTAFRNDDDGISVAGNNFLLVPPGNESYAVTSHWDLSWLKAGAIGVTSLGEGSASSVVPMTSAQLRQSYFMGGAVHRWPAGQESKGFFSAWQGTPPFDAASLMSWTRALHRQYLRFFGQNIEQPYGVFLRFNPVNAGGGTGFFHSFVLTYGAGIGADVAWLRITLAHEMFHTFQPYITVPGGKESSWFAEGLAVLYEGKLPLRYRLITPKAFLKNLNFTASRYYSSVMATQPNSEIVARFWEDTRIRTLAYDRAMLYFAVVDDAVRKKSHGQHSLDELMLQMLSLERQGVALSNSDWESVLRAELGDQAVTDFHEFLGGKMPIPAPDAFGPCFTRTTARVRRYELGFSPAVLSEPKRTIRGLMPGSAAAHAGLQNGDEIINPVPQDEIQGNQTELLKLVIRRDGKEFPIAYLPRGEEVEVYQWTRAPHSRAYLCGL